MNKTETERAQFGRAGDRLNHILDQIGFKKGRGRVVDLRNYLFEKAPEIFSDLKYTTVRSWFKDHAPSMHKINASIEALVIDYPIEHDLDMIKTWWKVGGFYPFSNKASRHFRDEDNSLNDVKTQFIVMALVTEELGDAFDCLNSDDLVKIKDKTVKFSQDFANPEVRICPEDYLRMFIRNEFYNITKHTRVLNSKKDL